MSSSGVAKLVDFGLAGAESPRRPGPAMMSSGPSNMRLWNEEPMLLVMTPAAICFLPEPSITNCSPAFHHGLAPVIEKNDFNSAVIQILDR